MFPPATVSHHHSLLLPLEVSVTHTPEEILQDAKLMMMVSHIVTSRMNFH